MAAHNVKRLYEAICNAHDLKKGWGASKRGIDPFTGLPDQQTIVVQNAKLYAHINTNKYQSCMPFASFWRPQSHPFKIYSCQVILLKRLHGYQGIHSLFKIRHSFFIQTCHYRVQLPTSGTPWMPPCRHVHWVSPQDSDVIHVGWWLMLLTTINRWSLWLVTNNNKYDYIIILVVLDGYSSCWFNH